MPSAARRIERLRLVAEAEATLARGRFLVEDAFRIASFPGETERRVLAIRRLELGVVDPDRSSAALAPVIEEAVREAAGRAVRFDDAAAPAADAVYFPDDLAAASAYVERLAAATSPLEWFWDSVFEGQVPPGDPEAGVRFALDRLLELPGGPARVAILVDVLRARGAVDRLLAWLRPTDGARLLGAFGLDAAPDRPGVPIEREWKDDTTTTDVELRRPRDAPPFTSPALRAWYVALGAWTARWGESDPRSRWLAVVALVSAQPSILAHAELRGLTGRVLRAARQISVTAETSRASRPEGRPSKPGGVAPLRRVSSPLAPVEEGAATSGRSPPSLVPASTAAPSTTGDRPDTAESATAEPAATKAPESTAASWDWDLHPTAAAGLLFVLPLLSRLGMAEVLAADSVLVELEFPLRLLLHIADRARVAKADTMRLPLEPASPGPLLDDWDGVLASWFARVRRALHRQARLGLRALVARPGQVAATRTHIDVVMPLRDLDIRVRRARLDADPGWVPWLGKVVSFHYEAEP